MVWRRSEPCRIVPDAMQDHVQAIRERVGRNVRDLRIERGWSQEQLAERVGNTDRHVGLVERGEVNVTIDILSTIAAHLSVDVARLFAAPEVERQEPPAYTITQPVLDQIEQALRAVVRVKDAGRGLERKNNE
jgi:transcriptional regulator with XRE-family HTH domain